MGLALQVKGIKWGFKRQLVPLVGVSLLILVTTPLHPTIKFDEVFCLSTNLCFFQKDIILLLHLIELKWKWRRWQSFFTFEKWAEDLDDENETDAEDEERDDQQDDPDDQVVQVGKVQKESAKLTLMFKT